MPGFAPAPQMPASKPAPPRTDLCADLTRWRTFVVIAELGSLTRAALVLNSNQSLLSRQINALERDCGARLFTRTGRGVELSEFGRRVQPRVRALLEQAEQLEGEIRGEASEPAGLVTLGSLPSISHPLVGRLYAELRLRHPAVRLKVLEGSSGQVEEWLVDARVDLAILYRYGSALPEQEQALAVVDSCLIGPPGDALTAAGEVPFSALDGLPFILPGAPNGLRTTLDALARQEHIALAPVVEADSLPLQKALVGQERLYTVLPLHAVWQEVADGRLQAARIVRPGIQRSVAMAFARSKGNARAVSAVAARIVAIVGDMAGKGMWHPRQPA